METRTPTSRFVMTVTFNSPTQVLVAWGASTDDVAVTGYRIYCNDLQVGAVASSTTNYTDNQATAGSTLTYAVRAVDAAGNVSPATTAAPVTTPQPGGQATSGTVPDATTASKGVVHLGGDLTGT